MSDLTFSKVSNNLTFSSKDTLEMETCQNQAFVAEMRCQVMILLRKNVN